MTLQELTMGLYIRPQNLEVVIAGTEETLGNPHLYKCDPNILAFEKVQTRKQAREMLLMLYRTVDVDFTFWNGVKYRPGRLTELRISRDGYCDGIVPVRVETVGDKIVIHVKEIKREA